MGCSDEELARRDWTAAELACLAEATEVGPTALTVLHARLEELAAGFHAVGGAVPGAGGLAPPARLAGGRCRLSDAGHPDALVWAHKGRSAILYWQGRHHPAPPRWQGGLTWPARRCMTPSMPSIPSSIPSRGARPRTAPSRPAKPNRPISRFAAGTLVRGELAPGRKSRLSGLCPG